MNDGTVTQDQKTMAMLSHLLGIFGFLGPLIIWLINKDKPNSEFVIDQSKEALNFQITVLIGYVICMILVFIIIGGLLAMALWLGNTIICILAGMKANEGVTYRYPFALRLIK